MAARAKPIFKWAGGKFKLLAPILAALPPGNRLVEPFVGSGAVFLNADYPAYVLADINPDLIGFYQTLAVRRHSFAKTCRALFTGGGNTADEYYARRDAFNKAKPGPKRFSLFLYLNRHCYNGLIRYNAEGKFNVPFGRYASPYFPETEIVAFLDKAKTSSIAFMTADFRKTFATVRQGDIVYCDPPYIPLSETANFTAYSGAPFGATEQRELAELVEDAHRRDVACVVSNHDAGDARLLYKNATRLEEIEVRRSISCDGSRRNLVKELLAIYQ